MLHHPRPKPPSSSPSSCSLDDARPPTRSERLLRDALLRDDSVRASSSSPTVSPSRQRSHTTPKPSSPSRTITPTPHGRTSTSPARKFSLAGHSSSMYYAGDGEFSSLSGSPPSPTRMTFRRSSRSEGQVPRQSLSPGGGESANSGRVSPTPHEVMLRARLEGVLSAARRMEHGSRARSSSRPRSPSLLRDASSPRAHARRKSSGGDAASKRSDVASSSCNDHSSSSLLLLTPPPTPPDSSSQHVTAYPCGRNISDPPLYMPSSRSPRSPPPKLFHSSTSPPGQLPITSPCASTFHQNPTPPSSSSPSPDSDTPPHMQPSSSSSSLSSLSHSGPLKPSSLNAAFSMPSFNARKASEHCRAMEGYVSFAAIEGLGSPPDGLDDREDDPAGNVDGKKGWINGLWRRG